jgi:hypothetical protein
MKNKFRYLISIFICLQSLTLCAEGENPSCPLLETGTPLAFAWFLKPAPSNQATIDDEEEEDSSDSDNVQSKNNEQKPRRWKKNSLKARAAFFQPTGEHIRHTYGNWWGEYSGEYNRYFHRQWSFFINGAYTKKHGRHHNSLYLVPVTLGVNARLGRFSFWHPYIGLGVGAVYGHWEDHHKGAKSRGGLATLAQAGMEFDLCRWLFLDLFGAYRWNWFHLNSTRKHNLAGGWTAGAGLGVRF